MLLFGNCHGDMSQPLFVMFVGVIRQGMLPFSRFPTFIAPTLPRKLSLSVGLSRRCVDCIRCAFPLRTRRPQLFIVAARCTHAHAVNIDRIGGAKSARRVRLIIIIIRGETTPKIDAENRRLLSGGARLPTRLFLP